MSSEGDDVLQPGSTFGRYVILRRIGAGGMGVVYEATHPGLKKRFAIKVLLPEAAKRENARSRFLREGEAAARIRHANVVDISDVGSEGGILYLVMEYLDGESLARRFARERRLSPEELADLMLPVVSAVSAAHDEGVIHRDLKPENIFLARDREGLVVPKVLDFGISKMVEDSAAPNLTGSGALLGTPFYLSPEQAAAGKAAPASDQYALGVILYEGVTGTRPFPEDSLYGVLNRIVRGDFPAPRTVCPEVPSDFEAAITRAMANRAEDRFESVRALGAALLPFAGERAKATWGLTFSTPRTLTLSHDDFVPRLGPHEGAPAPPPPARLLTTNASQHSLELSDTRLSLAHRRRGILAGAALAAVAVFYVAARLLLPNASTAPSAMPRDALATPVPASSATPPEVLATPVPASAPPALPREYSVDIATRPEGAAIEIDGAPAASGRHIFRDTGRHTLRVTTPGFEPRSLTFSPDEPLPHPIELTGVPVPTSPAPAPPPAFRARAIVPRIKQPPVPAAKPRALKVTPVETGANGSPLIE